MPNSEWKEYFAFSKKQRRGIFILVGIMVVFIFCTFWFKPLFTKPIVDADVQRKLTAIAAKHKYSRVDTLDEDAADSTKETTAAKTTDNKHTLFNFDPNTLDADGWRRLGFGEKTVEHILEYRKTKGRFNKPEDLYNVFRIRKKNVAAVLPYVRIGSGTTAVSPQNKTTTVDAAKPATNQVLASKTYSIININTATAEDFKVFPGVTDIVAARIIKYRTSLKGFTSIDDVAKTYDLPASSFKIMRPYLRL